MGWRERAACQGMDIWLFFGHDGESAAERGHRELEAKAVCANCPVRTQCRDYAIAHFVRHGIWGGLNEMERITERSARLAAVQGCGSRR